MEASYNGIALTGPTVFEHTGPVSIPWDIVLDVAPLVRSGSPFIAARDNRAPTISFDVRRRYPSILKAMEARAVFFRDLPKSGSLLLWQDAGGQRLTLSMEAFLAPMPAPELLGIAVRFSFSFAARSIAAISAATERLIMNRTDVIKDSTLVIKDS